MNEIDRPRPVIQATGLSKTFTGQRGSPVQAVKDVSLAIAAGETLGLIGESGSGKSTLGKLLLGLLAPDSGTVTLDGEPVTGAQPDQLRRLRTRMQVVFQEPYESLNPRMKVAAIVAEPLVVQKQLSKAACRERALEVIEAVGLPASVADRFPGELSGGQQQRVGIARAIVGRPRLVVLDEPTASLDRTIRRQITDLLLRLQSELGLAYLLITHDIASVRRMAGRSMVMFRGLVVESGPTSDVLGQPRHPYTKALVSAELPASTAVQPPRYRLKPRPAGMSVPAAGCPLRPTCPLAIAECARELPGLLDVGPGHAARCIRWEDVPLATSPGGPVRSLPGVPVAAVTQSVPLTGTE